ncbi:MAG: MSEP-CTERM sorting domain-containing protein [Gammaproteobacteria bacterium]|nr:MAG: MSEP-CTERM sorting domain-containing protein [Gammaproteobacteria bacterium]
MKNALNPKWLFLTTFIPFVLLGLAHFDVYNTINPILKPKAINAWFMLLYIFVPILITHLLLTIYLITTHKKLNFYIGLATFSTYTIAFYTIIRLGYLGDIMPGYIPRYMVSSDILFYLYAVMVPTLFYAIVVMVVSKTDLTKNLKFWKNFGITLAVPIVAYVFYQIILPLFKNYHLLRSTDFYQHSITVISIILALLFFFFLIRSLLLLSNKMANKYKIFKIILMTLFVLIFPLLGLYINNDSQNLNSLGIIAVADFSNHWFYILAAFNGVLLLLPAIRNQQYRLMIFLLKSITFSFTLYFFVVFLPLLPVSVILTAFIGLGFLILTPTVLFFIHTSSMVSDFKFLKFNKQVLYVVPSLGFLIIPLIIFNNFSYQRANLQISLDYVYKPKYDKTIDIDGKLLQNTLISIKKQKKKSRNSLSDGTPIIDQFYKNIVLDNLTLSDNKINHLNQIFFGIIEKKGRQRRVWQPPKTTKIDKIRTHTKFNQDTKTYKTWIDFDITNTEERQAEFRSVFKLPDGVMISNYYLMIEDKKEYGILAEKKSATWIYKNIVDSKRDPGLLYYQKDGKVVFKVFPFAKKQTRKTGIEFTHKQAFEIKFDEKNTAYVAVPSVISEPIQHKNISFIPAKIKKSLPQAKRQMFYHFIIDDSDNKKTTNYILQAQKIIKERGIDKKQTKTSLVNFAISDIKLDDYKATNNQKSGFYLERALKQTLINSYKKQTYPLIIVISDNFNQAVLSDDLPNFADTYNYHPYFYHIQNNNINKISYDDIRHSTKSNLPNPELNGFEFTTDNKTFYLPDNNKTSWVLNANESKTTTDNNKKEKTSWQHIMQLQQKLMSYHIFSKNSNKDWLNIIKTSFKSGIMTEFTSYIALENEAQKRTLLKKQQQVLKADSSLDTGGEPKRMSEPALFWLLFIFLLFYIARHKLYANRQHPT